MGTMNKDLALYNAKPMQDDGADNTDEEASDIESDSETEENVKLSEPSKDAIYNRDGLIDKLQDISWPDNMEWIHKLSVDIEQEQEVDVNDDLTRELAFYTQALEGTRKAFEKVEPMGLPFLRPADYYAEMVKSDTHMEKIKGRLLAEKKNIEESEERRKAREAKKLAKEVQAQKLKERSAQKKTEVEAVKKWRKQRQQSGFAGNKDGEMKLPFEDGEAFGRPEKRRQGVSPGDRSGGKAKQDWKRGGKKRVEKKQMKRETRNSKFGNGGRKGLKKQNTADSVDNFRGSNNGGRPGNNKRKR
ncbi:probable rRNA-processing protein EBP2 homolog [Euphorbia lathyris]|uniref:probable rRNA-processing protein EBP2 homolog n=1 Tax=Euphorbia lathyris TaxID=212925 RepID=UPI003313B2CC